jgi:hypothetical protein
MIPLEAKTHSFTQPGDCIPSGRYITLDRNMGIRLIPTADPAFVAGTLGPIYLLQVHTARGKLGILRSQKARFDSSLLHPGKENMHKLNRKLQILLTLVATFGAQG